MPLRSFTDSSGHRWEVWEAHVRAIDRRVLADRRRLTRATIERRVRAFLGQIFGAQNGSGWLVFRSSFGKWRLSPVPDRWEQLSDAALHWLIARADRATGHHFHLHALPPSAEYRAQ